MSIPRWPADLPQCPTYDGYRESRKSDAAVFQPDVGASISRRRSTVRIRRVAVTFQMTGDQVSLFEDFFDNEISDGVLPYRWVDPRRNTDRKWKFDLQEGQDPYSIAPAGGRAYNLFDVSFVVLDIGA